MVIEKWSKEYKKEYQKRYYQKNRKIMDAKTKIYYEKNKNQIDSHRKEYSKKYYQKNKNKLLDNSRKYYRKYYIKNKKNILEKQKIYRKSYLKNNPHFRISGRLRVLLLKALNKYAKTGKYQSSVKYGINYKAIIEHLKPFPKDLSKYHIDHIRPLCSFDLTDPEEIKKAFVPENHQWLLIRDNLIKGGKY